MRLVYYGTPALAVPPLRRLVAGGWAPSLVVTRPDRPRGRGLQTGRSAVREAAEALRLPVATPPRAGAVEEIARVRALSPDLLVLVAYGQILPRALLDVPRLGALNLHFSLLPRHRGASPIQAAILAGDKETGVTTLWMTEGLDEGPTFLSMSTAVDPEENAECLGARLASLGAECLAETLRRIEGGAMVREAQDPDRASYAPKIGPDAGRLSLDLSADDVVRRVRAFTPEPGAYLELESGRLLVREAIADGGAGTERDSGREDPPGAVLGVDRGSGLRIALRRGSVWLRRVRPSGRREMAGFDYANGARLKPGDRLPVLSVSS